MRVYHRQTTVERLQKMTGTPTATGCWPWMGNINKDGYGLTKHERKTIQAHRASYMVHVGEIPKGLFVLHSCDVRECINPQHLHVGTAALNARERSDRDRGAPQHGEFNPCARLTAAQALEIRTRARAGERTRLLAEAFAVSQATVLAIRNGQRWARHLAIIDAVAA